MDSNGADLRQLTITEDVRERSPRIDPTGTVAVYERIEAAGKSEIWLFSSQTQQAQITAGGPGSEALAGTPYVVGSDANPVLSPDNQFVASIVEEDVAFGPENSGLPPDEILRRVDEALDIVGMADYRTHPPQRLSGGQKQRVAIAGALATRPACIVFDEPTSMLDPLGRRQLLRMIQQLNVEEGITVVLITHSMDEAAVARRVLVLHAGRIVMDESPEVAFEREERLRGLGLDLPFAIEISHRLRDRGMTLPSGLLTVPELGRALCASGQ